MKRYVASGEMLAMDLGGIRRDADGLFWLMGPDTPGNARHALFDDVAIVHVRGALEHHVTPGADSYEGILAKLESAKSGTDADEKREPPSAIVACIDSRGGVVAGLNSTVEAIQRMFPRSGIPLVWYVNEMAASAAYALCCSGREIVGPASCITGSIGTISTMISVAKQDEMTGIDVRLIASGPRKTDGHPHAPITDAAEDAERERVEDLAASFFDLASKARGLPYKKIESLGAGIFLGPRAKSRGLIDSVLSLDDVARALSKTRSPGAKASGNETNRRALSG